MPCSQRSVAMATRPCRQSKHKESFQPVVSPVRAAAYLIAVLPILGGSLNGVSVAAAQGAPGGACAIVSDAMIAPAHAIQGLNAPGLESCVVRGGTGRSIAIYHITGPVDPDDIAMPGPLPATLASTESVPVAGIGDSAVLQRGTIDGKALVSLRVQRADEVFAFIADDASETPDRLLVLAKAVLVYSTQGDVSHAPGLHTRCSRALGRGETERTTL
jgi:hypothetical protein